MLTVNTILRQSDNHIELYVRVTPNGSCNEIIGILDSSNSQNRLLLKVQAVPEKGKANKAAIKYLSKQLQIPKSMITITSGSNARKKTLLIVGDPDGIILSLAKLLPA